MSDERLVAEVPETLASSDEKHAVRHRGVRRPGLWAMAIAGRAGHGIRRAVNNRGARWCTVSP